MDKLTAIKVLGTAQDAGFAQLNCNCPHCQKAREKSDFSRMQSSIAVIDKKESKSFILDASPAFSRQLDILNSSLKSENINNDHFSGILLTHAHIGHYAGLIYLGKEALNTSNFPVYLSSKMLGFLEKNAPWSDLFNNKNLKAVVFEFGRSYQLTENVSFKAVEVEHRNEHADTAGFIVNTSEKSFFYLPDFDSWSSFAAEFRKIIKEVDYAFIDGTFFDKNELKELRGRDLAEVPHPPIIETMELLKDLKQKNKKKIYFTHFNHTNRIFANNGKAVEMIKEKGYNILEEGELFS